jgi:hypothetical protein
MDKRRYPPPTGPPDGKEGERPQEEASPATQRSSLLGLQTRSLALVVRFPLHPVAPRRGNHSGDRF